MGQIQYNYRDENYQAGKEGLEHAAEKGIGVVIMEPLRAAAWPKKRLMRCGKVWDSSSIERSAAEWALRWVWNHPQVATVLSGMSNMEQFKENISIANNASANFLSRDERELIGQVTQTYKKMLKIDCTGCVCCMPCPNGVNLPLNFSLYNDTFVFGDEELAKMIYSHFLSPEQKASTCAECGECEEHCPRQLSIREELKRVHARLAG